MTDKPLTFADQAAPIAALALLQAGCRELPVVRVQFDAFDAVELTLSMYDQPGALDAWIAAIAPKDVEVTTRTQNGGRTAVREAKFLYAGVETRLIDFSTVETGEAS